MDITELRYFLAVVKEKSISKASKALFISQPSLSVSMQNLEKEIGKKLFERGRKNIELTAAGYLLKEKAEEIINIFEKAQAELKTSDENIIGTITIGAGESHLMKIVAEAAKLVTKNHPNVKFKFLSGDSSIITEKLDNGLIDFGVLVLPTNLSKYESIKLKEHDIWGVIAKNTDALAKKEFITPNDIIEKPLILSNQTTEHNEISQWFEKDINSLNIVAIYDLIYNASILVKEGLGYLIGINNIVETSTNSGLTFIPLEPEIKTTLAIVWRKYQKLSKANQLFLETLKELNR